MIKIFDRKKVLFWIETRSRKSMVQNFLETEQKLWDKNCKTKEDISTQNFMEIEPE